MPYVCVMFAIALMATTRAIVGFESFVLYINTKFGLMTINDSSLKTLNLKLLTYVESLICSDAGLADGNS